MKQTWFVLLFVTILFTTIVRSEDVDLGPLKLFRKTVEINQEECFRNIRRSHDLNLGRNRADIWCTVSIPHPANTSPKIYLDEKDVNWTVDASTPREKWVRFYNTATSYTFAIAYDFFLDSARRTQQHEITDAEFRNLMIQFLARRENFPEGNRLTFRYTRLRP